MKKYYFITEPRTMWEPIKPGKRLPRPIFPYIRRINGHSHPWMAYCVYRSDWLMRTLVGLGVSVEHFKIGGTVPRRKCLEIARALKKVRGKQEDFQSEKLLNIDIRFFAHCGGLRIHDWKSTLEI